MAAAIISDKELWPIIAKAKYSQSWQLLKSKIEVLYIRQERVLSNDLDRMNARLCFLAKCVNLILQFTELDSKFQRGGMQMSLPTMAAEAKRDYPSRRLRL